MGFGSQESGHQRWRAINILITPGKAVTLYPLGFQLWGPISPRREPERRAPHLLFFKRAEFFTPQGGLGKTLWGRLTTKGMGAHPPGGGGSRGGCPAETVGGYNTLPPHRVNSGCPHKMHHASISQAALTL